MYISEISFSPKIINKKTVVNEKKAIGETNKTTTINLNYSPAFKGNMYNFTPLDEKSFLDKGGILRYDFAASKNGTPYSGRLVNDSKNMQVVSSYQNGQKTSINIAWSQRDDMDDISIHLKKEDEMNNSHGGKTLVWTNVAKDIEYLEDYDLEGKLVHTGLFGYKSAQDNTIIMTVQRDFEKDGITPYREETTTSEEYKHLFSYTSRISLATENGTKEIYYDADSKDKTRTSASRTLFFNRFGRIYKSSEEDVTYFDPKNNAPYAKSDRRVVFRDKKGDLVVRDFNFRTTDYTQGAGPMRKFVYDEHPSTIRDIKGSTYFYYDGLTKKRYAAEEYEEGKDLPVCIANFDKKYAAEIKDVAKNLLIVNIFANFEKLATSIMFEKRDGKYNVKEVDVFDPKTEKRTITRRVLTNGTITTQFFDEKGKMIETNKQLPENAGGEET